MDYPYEILVKDYFEIHNYYSNIFGIGRTIILMQVGSFHECYCTDNDGLDLVKLSEEMDIACTRKNKNIPLSKTNPRMMGFPIGVTKNYMDKLVDMNYTVVLIDQITEPPQPKRKVVGIYSPATHIEKKGYKTNYLLSIVLDKIKSNNNLIIGLCAYDLSTGKGSVYETYSKENDIMIALDDTLRFMEHYPAREIILENNLSESDLIMNMSVEDILNYLSIKKENVYKIKIKNHKKLGYQKLKLENIYKIDTNIDILEYLGLEFLNLARYSLILLLDYVEIHQMRLLDYLSIPSIFTSSKYLYLGNKALEQLNYDSLFNIINCTKTALGKRLLNFNLTMPIIDSKILKERYNSIENLINNNKYKKLVDYLEDIYDLDRLIRKMEIKIINPYELYQMYISLYQFMKMSEYCKTNNLFEDMNINMNKLKDILNYIESRFNIQMITELNFTNYLSTSVSFYNKDIYEDIDNLQSNINTSKNFMNYLIEELEKFIPDKKGSDLISLKSNDKDGHYLLLTTRRCDLLRKNLTVEKLKIGSIYLNVSDLEFDKLPKSANTKINCKKIKEISISLVDYEINLAKKLKEKFYIDMLDIFNNYNKELHIWANNIAYIDFINSGAIVAIQNHYSKPNIEVKEASYFKAKELRHPIVEKINSGYIPHNIELGYNTEQNGIVLYGINSAGKSTLMKSIGLNIILAQMGYYVAATNFTYSPYNTLFTRISGNDNIFKGLSSFMVEMMELMAILKRNNNKTLIIADEICRGTELKSSVVIVSYMIETLDKSNSSFITATHLHDLINLSSIKNLSKVRLKHLKITYDQINDNLIYDRHLSDGQGETFYGLQVAKYMMKDKNFNERTTEILEEYMNVNIKSSKYNSDIYLDECVICSSKINLEVHHIIFQKEFDKNDINNNKFYLKKNDKNNLVCLCRICHDRVDKNEIIINGWKETSKGRILDYKIEEMINQVSKYDNKIIDYIKSLKELNDVKLARIRIKETQNRKISTQTIIKIWNNI